MIGWNVYLRYGAYAAVLSRAWACYLMKLFKLMGLPIPIVLNNYEWGIFDFSVLAPLCLLLCCWVKNRGTLSLRTEKVFVYIKLLVLVLTFGVAMS